MESTKVRLRNDQNNHLNDQIEQFDDFAPVVRKPNTQLYSSLCEAFNSDEVTSIYIRGYN
ncbi:hypothetical protein [Shewanella woodyi]|uniref:Uncharacterized protein n=1 Tax=Shewanella woodyi (strain ATCC 51908 / MS32) TaxID=392500 RepID=B1KJ84_SHEWM|nr:hypothetical protein [Shewanella woodyi]ACA87104.1 hypothetical protein Swoo_2829 [Shewanella woodyi ATCC 51908]